MHIVRIILAVVLALLALLFLFSAFTVPAVSATPYLIIGLVLVVAMYFISPFRFGSKKTKPVT